MATAPQQAPQGGLGAMAPAKPVPDAQPANPAQAAQRISSLEQAPAEEDFMERALRNKRAQEEALNSQIEALKNSLDSRMKPAFDPALMAAASGFLKPTKTGGFGESAGYAAEAYAAETDKELARRQAVDKAKLELAQKQAQMQSQNLMFEHQMKMAGVDPSETTRLTTGPSGVAPAAGGAPAEGAPAAPRQSREPRMITERDIQVAMAISPDYGKQVMEQAKFQQDRYLSTPQGLIDKRTGKPVDTGLEVPLEKNVPYLGAEKITQSQDQAIKLLKEKYPLGHPDRENAFAQYYASEGLGGGGIKYTPAVDGKPASSSTLKSAGERESERKAEEETQKLRITEGEKRASTLIDRGQAADTTKQIALDMSAYADSNPRVFQLMQTATLKDAVLRSIEKMGAPLNIDPRTILQYKLQDKDIEALQMFAQKSAQLTVELRKASRAPGEGATTESEGKLYAQVEALPTDSARVIGLKSELLALRTDYDKAAATLWVDWREQNPGKSFDKFRLSSDEFKALRKSYDSTLEAVRKANTDLLRTAPKVETTPESKSESKPSTPPANETPMERLKRRKAEIDKQQGKQ